MTGIATTVQRLLWQSDDSGLSPADRTAEIHRLILEVDPLATPAAVATVQAEVCARIDGLGPLHRLGLDPLVSEIMVNGDGSVWVERSGQVVRTEMTLTESETNHLARRLASHAGRRIDAAHPSVDVRMADGSRMHAIVPPLAVDGPCITIRRFMAVPVELDEMIQPEGARVLHRAIRDRETIIVCGATGSGKTTLLNAFGALLSLDERIVTIEDAAELQLPGEHVIRLETRPATEGTEAVGLRELTRNALRMRPDRIICGEMRGAEALDLVQAMNTGHRGSMSTVHANSCSDALRRIETMMLLGDAALPLHAIREQLASCIDLVVMTERAEGAHRHVTSIERVPREPTTGWLLEKVWSQ